MALQQQLPEFCDVLVVGSLNIDQVVVTVAGLPKPGETLLGKTKGIFFGGKGANQAVAASRLQGKVEIIGAVGDDADGKLIRQALSSENVLARYVKDRGQTTGFASVTVSGSEGENTVIVVPGANALLSTADLTIDAFKSTKVVLCQNEIPLRVTKEALRLAKSEGCLTIWNPAPAPVEDCDDVLKYVDVLCLNETEAIAVSKQQDLPKAIQLLSVKVGQSVIITLGKDGCMLANKGSKEIITIPAAFVGKVVDTTGAGDCFCGSLALLLSRRATMVVAITLSNMVAGESVKNLGAQASYPTLSSCPQPVKQFFKGASL